MCFCLELVEGINSKIQVEKLISNWVVEARVPESRVGSKILLVVGSEFLNTGKRCEYGES